MISRIKKLRFFINDPNKKPYWLIIKEAGTYGWLKKEIPSDYIRKHLYRKGVVNYGKYLSMKQYRSIINSPNMVYPEISSLLKSKLSFAFFCSAYNLPVPKLLSYNLKNHFFFGESVFKIKTKQELIIFFENVFKKTGQTRIFIKMLEKNGGFGCLVLNKNTFENDVEIHAESLLKNCYIHQEVLEQHPLINKINANAISTLRIDTYIDPVGKTHILSALMRFGIGASITDNSSSGDIFVSVDMQKGELRGTGKQNITSGGGEYVAHPDSRVVFDKYTIPFFKHTKKLVKKAVDHFPNRIIGWDIAKGLDGPYIIEGNSDPSLHMSDMAYGGYCNHPLIQEILKQV
ncbi:sugar-transfer associated ATP-grasp domain-containing protein [Ascidiimonas aurantiaca]|uniref:sugar-transfer associated ATP-grasp domain-containing protein n=1 Tax=Ascidiimonas aurantiaca TaxID=1685432 RepID=UPI0030EBBA45